jgi:hypothetical protein
MAERTPSGEPHVNTSAGHLSVHVEGEHPPEVIFSFEQQSQRLVPAFGVAFVLQVGIVLLFVLLARFAPTFTITPATIPEDISDRIVWLSQPGPGGAGGGGGNQMKEPPKQAELLARTRSRSRSRSLSRSSRQKRRRSSRTRSSN